MLTYLNLFMNVLRLFFVWNLDKGCIQKNRINKRKMKKKKKGIRKTKTKCRLSQKVAIFGLGDVGPYFKQKFSEDQLMYFCD